MSEIGSVDVDEFVGKRFYLDAVDEFIEPSTKEWDHDANGIRFRLDGVVYTAMEDPSDGYRSSLRDIHRAAEGEIAMTNVFPPCEVKARKMPNGEYGTVNDVVEFVDVKTAKIVLAVGTENTDDYYPSFTGRFWPEAMATNAAVKSEEPTLVPEPEPTSADHPIWGTF